MLNLRTVMQLIAEGRIGELRKILLNTLVREPQKLQELKNKIVSEVAETFKGQLRKITNILGIGFVESCLNMWLLSAGYCPYCGKTIVYPVGYVLHVADHFLVEHKRSPEEFVELYRETVTHFDNEWETYLQVASLYEKKIRPVAEGKLIGEWEIGPDLDTGLERSILLTIIVKVRNPPREILLDFLREVMETFEHLGMFSPPLGENPLLEFILLRCLAVVRRGNEAMIVISMFNEPPPSKRVILRYFDKCYSYLPELLGEPRQTVLDEMCRLVREMEERGIIPADYCPCYEYVK